MERKIVKMGNSLGSTFPPEVLKHIQAKQGDEVEFIMEENGTVRIRKQNKVVLPKEVDADFIKTVTHVIDKYDRAINELAKR
ncbi:MAG: AbrB family transcriptional regulator [Sporolactobacillus sp.]|nr:AbrB family transcriptional regulator [Sporolactobacillus sp.]